MNHEFIIMTPLIKPRGGIMQSHQVDSRDSLAQRDIRRGEGLVDIYART